MSAHDVLIDESILRVGEIISVEGRTVKILVDKSKNVSHLNFKGKVLRNVSVGGYLRIAKGFESIICKIEGEFTEEVKVYGTKEYRDAKEAFRRVLRASMVGFYERGKFKKGVKELPLVGNTSYLLNNIEVNEIHAFVDPEDTPLDIGVLASDRTMPIRVGVNSLFASHIGIFGNTGSGKSYTLAKLYHVLFERFKDHTRFQKNASFFLIDFNGEYARRDLKENESDNTIVNEEHKRIYKLSTREEGGGDKFPLASSALHDPNLWAVLLEATEKTQVPFIRRSIESKYIESALESNQTLVDFILKFIYEVTTYKDRSLDKSTVINFLNEIENIFDESGLYTPLRYLESKLEFFAGNNTFYLNEKPWVFADKDEYKENIKKKFEKVSFRINEMAEIRKIRLKIVLNYYSEILRGFSNQEHLSPLIKRLGKRFDDIEKVITSSDGKREKARNLCIVSLKDVNIQMRKILPLLFTKNLYEEHKKNNNEKKYLNIIIDEAHNVLSPNSNRESEQWKDYRLETFEEIIKEGRKFGVFLTIASQRPYDISPTIISQLHNYFIHRLINNKDIESIERNLSYMDKVSVDSLSILPTGTCVLAGVAAQMPIIIEIGGIPGENVPSNDTIRPTKHWE